VKKVLAIPTLLLLLAAFSPLVAAEKPIDFRPSSDYCVRTYHDGSPIWWAFENLQVPVTRMEVGKRTVRILNDNSDAGRLYDMTMRVDPERSPVYVSVIDANQKADVGEVAWRAKMEDDVVQYVGLHIQNLKPNSYYMLYKNGTEVHGRDSDDEGDWSYTIEDVSSVYTLKREEHVTAPPPPPAPPKKKPLTVEVKTGSLKGGRFIERANLGLGEVATVQIKVTSEGEPVEGADVGAWWIPKPLMGKIETIEISEVGGGIYQGSFAIPENIALGTYKVSADAQKSGYEKAFGYDTFGIVSKAAKPGPGPLDKVAGWARKNPATVAVLIAAIFLFVLIARR